MVQKKIKLDRKPGLYLAAAGHKGRGVFCGSDIKKGEVLETTPAILLNEKATDAVEDIIINDYTFETTGVSRALQKRASIKKSSDGSAVVMGIAAYCNHDEKPNAEVIWEETSDTLYYILRATRNIPKNTEICTSYGRDWFEDRK